MLDNRTAVFVRDAVTDAIVAAFSLLVRDSNRGVSLDATLVELKHEVIKSVNHRIAQLHRYQDLESQGFSVKRLDDFLSERSDKE